MHVDGRLGGGETGTGRIAIDLHGEDLLALGERVIDGGLRLRGKVTHGDEGHGLRASTPDDSAKTHAETEDDDGQQQQEQDPLHPHRVCRSVSQMSALPDPRSLRRVVLIVAGLNFGYFWVETGVALAIGSVSLFADGIDFLEDTAVNLLIALALGWSLRSRARVGRLMAAVLLVPAAAAVWQLVHKAQDPAAPDVRALLLTCGGAIVINALSAWLLSRVRQHGGSLSSAAFLSARNDVLINLAIMAMALVTAVTGSGWPDVVLGGVIIALNVSAAREVWELASQESLAARALAGEDLD